MKKVSIIIPVYNVSQYLRRCLDSVIGQTYKNIEIVLIDDGSTDESSDICNEYGNKYHMIKYMKTTNGGVSAARNHGLNNVTGDFIMFVDADDYIDYSMVEELVKAIGDKCDMAICGKYCAYEDGKITEQSLNYKGKIVDSRKEYSRKLVQWGPMCKLFRREIIKGVFFPKVKLAEDLAFLCDVICKNENFKIAVLNKSLYYYVMRDNSAMKRKYDKDVLVNVRTQDAVLKQFVENDISVQESGILRDAIEVFYWKYYSETGKRKTDDRDDLKEVNSILRKNREYLVAKENGTNRVKMYIFLYIPFIYACYINFRSLFK